MKSSNYSNYKNMVFPPVLLFYNIFQVFQQKHMGERDVQIPFFLNIYKPWNQSETLRGSHVLQLFLFNGFGY